MEATCRGNYGTSSRAGAVAVAQPYEVEFNSTPLLLITTRTDNDGGAQNVWGIFDWAQSDARNAWIDRIASVVSTADLNGENLFDGVFIDGYRGASGWANGLIPQATDAEKAAWLAGATLLGPALADALGNDTVRFINPGEVFSSFPGYSANSIEFFGPDDGDIKFLQSIVGVFPTIEVHAYIGDNLALFNLTLAAYLVAVGPGAYFGTGAEWAMCDDWLIPHWEFDEPLGEPDAPAAQNGSVWTRSFAGGATTVALDTGSSGHAACSPESVGAASSCRCAPSGEAPSPRRRCESSCAAAT